jgi:hypothetical protein
MNALWNAIAAQVATHLPEVEAVVAALLIAGIFAIPEKIPTSLQEWWTWFRDTLQGAVPMKLLKQTTPGAAPSVGPRPIPPAGPAEEK